MRLAFYTDKKPVSKRMINISILGKTTAVNRFDWVSAG